MTATMLTDVIKWTLCLFLSTILTIRKFSLREYDIKFGTKQFITWNGDVEVQNFGSEKQIANI